MTSLRQTGILFFARRLKILTVLELTNEMTEMNKYCFFFSSFRQDIFPDKATERKILSFVIKCTSEGCQWTGELRSKDVRRHSYAILTFSVT